MDRRTAKEFRYGGSVFGMVKLIFAVVGLFFAFVGLLMLYNRKQY